MHECPGGDSCTGPGGTKYSPARLYGWNAWKSQMFVKDSLLALFPDRHDEISKKVDIGEYGMEDYWCRFACVFIFMLAMMEEILNLVRTIMLIYVVPSVPELWVTYVGPLDDTAEVDITSGNMDHLQIKIAGMDHLWKVINILIVVVPKGLIMKLTLQTGVCFLMETAAIEGVIVNAVALAFLLSIDEMFFNNVGCSSSKHIMEVLENFSPKEETQEESDFEVKYTGRSWSTPTWFPTRFMIVLIVTIGCLADYYARHCTLPEGGSWIGGWVSRPMFTPKSTAFNWGDALFPWLFHLEVTDSPAYWSMHGS